MSKYLSISSLVAQVAPEKREQVRAAMEAVPYVEVPIVGENGKLVVLIDAPHTRIIVETLDILKNLPGVISLLPVYQHEEQETASLLAEERQ
ncbi:chaperone NapD [Sneathiella chinensis]|uniref:Chaperone NapD n=1 Tax=Sneathiella chinensis TaxID=349750 RepID=A0ABQ5U3E4_9PROT|nr:chaperone NapD [Sneathiella chinensis]GLQ05021.1 hypothetical protein GCM10007924_02420 [Sneathiella chinensis]